MSAGAVLSDSVAKPSGVSAVASAAVPPKRDFGAVGAPNWTKLLGEDVKGTVFASRPTMKAAVEKALSEGLIDIAQAEHLNDAIDNLPTQERPTYAEASKLLTDFGLDVTRSVKFTTDSVGNSVVSFLDLGDNQAPKWENLIANETSDTDSIPCWVLNKAVDSAYKKGLIGPTQVDYIKDTIAQLDNFYSPPNLKEAAAQLESIGLVVTKPVDIKSINAIPGSLAVTDTKAGTAQKPNWENLLKAATPAGNSAGLGSTDFYKAIDAARAAGVINIDQQTFLKDAVAYLPVSKNLTPTTGAKLLTDIGLDVKKTVEVTTDSKGVAAVSFVDMGSDQAPKWENLIANETSDTDSIPCWVLNKAVDSAYKKGLIGPTQVDYIKDTIAQLDNLYNPPNLREAAAQLESIGLVVTKPVDIKSINAIPGSLAVTDTKAGTAQKPNWENLLKAATPAGNSAGLGSTDFCKAIDAARAAGVINIDQQTFLKDAVAYLPVSKNLTPTTGAKLLTDIGLDVKKTVEVTTDSKGVAAVSFVDMGSDQAPKWENLIAHETPNTSSVPRWALDKAVDSAQEKGFIGPKQTDYVKGAIAQLDTSSNPPNLQVAAAQLHAIGLVVTKGVDIDAINALNPRKP